FFNDPPTPEISPLSLHDALPILPSLATVPEPADEQERQRGQDDQREDPDRKQEPDATGSGLIDRRRRRGGLLLGRRLLLEGACGLLGRLQLRRRERGR